MQRTTNGKMIKADGLYKRFGDIQAVKDVSFSVKRGEIFGFLGPNGAGKTTTIRMLTGLIPPDSGQIYIDGRRLADDRICAKMKMGVIPELGNIYIDLTAEQNLQLAGKFYGMSKDKLNSRTAEVLKRFKIYDRKDELVRNFSKGLKQRVNVASAIIHEPELLFLDEPTSGLDVQSQRLIKDIIKEMNDKGSTIFLTTHYIEEANLLCERVGIINEGEIVIIDRPEKLRSTFEATQSVEISFNREVDSEKFTGGRMINKKERLGDKWKLYTDDPDRLVKHLVDFVKERDIKIVSLETCRPSLEDAFVMFTKNDEKDD